MGGRDISHLWLVESTDVESRIQVVQCKSSGLQSGSLTPAKVIPLPKVQNEGSLAKTTSRPTSHFEDKDALRSREIGYTA